MAGRKLIIWYRRWYLHVADRKPKGRITEASPCARHAKRVTQVDILEQHSDRSRACRQDTLLLFAWMLWIPTNRKPLSSGLKQDLSRQLFQSPVSAWASNSLLQSRHQLYLPRSRCSSPRTTWPTSRGSPASPRCSQPATRSTQAVQGILHPDRVDLYPLLCARKLCVGCARGFEVVSLETLETQSLLDQADTSLDFVVKKENIKPIHIERLASEFLALLHRLLVLC